jgi:hypothetical protein
MGTADPLPRAGTRPMTHSLTATGSAVDDADLRRIAIEARKLPSLRSVRAIIQL